MPRAAARSLLRPQPHAAVADLAREADALVDQPRADAEPARLRLDQQQPQLGDASSTALDQEHAADVLAVALGDPAALALRIEAPHEARHDLGDQRLELARRSRTPARRARRGGCTTQPMSPGRCGAQQVGRARSRRGAPSRRFDRAHRAEQPPLLGAPERARAARATSSLRARVERRERVAARRGQRQQAAAGRRAAPRARSQQARALEAAQDAAQVAGVEAELAARARSRSVRSRCASSYSTRTSVSENGLSSSPSLQHADAPRVEAVEAAHRGDLGLLLALGHLGPPAMAVLGATINRVDDGGHELRLLGCVRGGRLTGGAVEHEPVVAESHEVPGELNGGPEIDGAVGRERGDHRGEHGPERAGGRGVTRHGAHGTAPGSFGGLVTRGRGLTRPAASGSAPARP